MSDILGVLRALYQKRLLLVAVVVVLALVACTSQGSAPPSGPIGGGC